LDAVYTLLNGQVSNDDYELSEEDYDQAGRGLGTVMGKEEI